MNSSETVTSPVISPLEQRSWRDGIGRYGMMRASPVRSVSVVTVCYNARDSIRLTLESVKRQSFPLMEHVVIDGGSTDGTQAIVREYNVGYFVSEKDKGIYDAMDKGARAARGDILIFLNAGDLFFDDNVCRDVAAYFEEQKADMVFGNLLPAYLRPSDSHDHGAFQPGLVLDLSYYANRRHIYDESIHHQATFYRRWIFDQCSYKCEVPEATGEYHVLMRAALRHNAQIRYMPRAISRFMLGGKSTSNFEAEWERYVRARDALRAMFCPSREAIVVSSESEFLPRQGAVASAIPADPPALAAKRWLKSVLKATPPFKAYDRIARGLTARVSDVVDQHVRALHVQQTQTLHELDAGTGRQFAILGRTLDQVTGSLGEVNGTLQAFTGRFERVGGTVDRVANSLDALSEKVAVLEEQLRQRGRALDLAHEAQRQSNDALERMAGRLETFERQMGSALAEQSERGIARFDVLAEVVKSQASYVREALEFHVTNLEIAAERNSQNLSRNTQQATQDIASLIRRRAGALQRAVGAFREETHVSLARVAGLLGRDDDMASHGFKAFSQWDEDGLLQYLFSKIPQPTKTFAEIGVGDYSEANTRLLVLKDNWRGVIVDCDDASIAAIQMDPILWKHTVEPVHALVTAENVNSILKSKGIEGEIGLLSIDIDGMDYWVWQAVDVCTPQVVVIEYNGLLGPDAALTLPYNAQFDRRTAHYSWLYAGASFAALVALGREKGYTCMGANFGGNNLFFVRNDLVAAGAMKPSSRQFVAPLFRESRNEDGQLTFLPAERAVALIANERFVEIGSGRNGPLSSFLVHLSSGLPSSEMGESGKPAVREPIPGS